MLVFQGVALSIVYYRLMMMERKVKSDLMLIAERAKRNEGRTSLRRRGEGSSLLCIPSEAHSPLIQVKSPGPLMQVHPLSSSLIHQTPSSRCASSRHKQRSAVFYVRITRRSSCSSLRYHWWRDEHTASCDLVLGTLLTASSSSHSRRSDVVEDRLWRFGRRSLPRLIGSVVRMQREVKPATQHSSSPLHHGTTHQSSPNSRRHVHASSKPKGGVPYFRYRILRIRPYC